MTGRLYRRFELCCHRHTPKLSEHLDEIRGEALMLFGRWLAEGGLRENESVPYLARRIWSQASAAFVAERKRQKKDVPMVQELPTGEEGTPHWLERALSRSEGLANQEERLAVGEEAEWLARTKARLSPGDRATFEAEVAVDAGEAASLGEALAVNEATARKRRQRLREAIVALARADGCEDILERAHGARSRRRDRKDG